MIYIVLFLAILFGCIWINQLTQALANISAGKKYDSGWSIITTVVILASLWTWFYYLSH